jgi:outer membrane receptor protein involved in Fe transport
MLRSSFRLVLSPVLALLLAFPALAGADITRFDLSGTVKDSTGAVVPGATVTLRNLDTGFNRSTVCDAAGRYSFNAVPPAGRWTLTAELQGFAAQHREGLEFQANTKPEINLQLGVGGLQEAITVQAATPLIRTRESELSSILEEKQVDALPTNGRNFLSLLQTSGSVVPTGNGSSALSVNGQGTRLANFVADGVSMTGREIRTLNGEFGGGNGLSIDVVKELQVITNGFKAETGQTGAGTISVVTKSGTNRLSGSAYGFWRPSDLVAANLLTGLKTTQKRQQYGGTIGGPIKRDQTHYFANYESAQIDDAVVVTSVLAPGTFPAPQRQKQGFFKLNHRFNDRNNLDARYSFNRNRQETQGVGGLNTFDRRSNTEGRTDAFVTSLVTNIGNKVNEARFRYTFDVVDFYSPLTASTGAESRTPDFSQAPVTVTYTGVGNLGTNPGFPQNLVEKRAQWVDHFSVVKGSHQLKAGVDVIGSWRFVTFFNNFAGTYTFAQGAKYPFNASDSTTFPVQFTQTFGNSGLNFTDYMAGVFAQDDWEIHPGLTLNVGLRWDKDSLFQGDNNNVAPRIGFAWNVGSDGKTVIRGNTGIFYDTLESSAINRESNTGPVGQTTIDLRTGDPLFPTFPNRLSSFPTGAGTVARATVYVPVFQGDAFPGSIGSDSFHRSAPYFFNANLGIQRELGADMALSADYTRVYGYDMLVTWDTNAPSFFALGPGQTRTVAQANATRPLGVPNTTGGSYGIPFTGFRSLYLQFNGGHTEYNALKLGINKRMSHHFALQANYTLGKARGDVDNFRLANSFVPGLTALDGDRSFQLSRSDTDVRHVFVVSGTYEAPFGIRVGGIAFARSGFPYTGVVGLDSDGDGFSSNGSYGDRPASLARNSFQYPATVTVDTSVAYDVKIVGAQRLEIRFDVFNLANRKNISSVNNIIGLDPSAPPATFGTVTGVRDQRQAQIALRYRF